MRPLPTALALVAAGLLVVGAAACGRDSTADFKNDYEPVNSEIQQTGRQVAAAIKGAGSKTDQQIASQFSALAADTNRLVRKLQAIDPPGDIESDYRKLINGLDASADDLNAIAAAAAASDPDAARTASQKLARDSVTVSDARRAVAKQAGLD